LLPADSGRSIPSAPEVRMSRHDESHRWQFEMLMVLAEEGRTAELDELFHKLLRQSHATLGPLCDFVIEQPNHARIAILLKLLAKMGSLAAAPILIRFLEIDVRELRLQAITGLGWLRARAALERLDDLENSEDDEVRREAQVAVEEILRDFPTMRPHLKYHERIAIKRDLVGRATPDEIAHATPPGGDERRRLVGMFPRLLAMKYKAAPLGMGAGGVVAMAVNAEAKGDPTDLLRRLLGREVELRGWPLDRLHERILTFYKWGDEDWIEFGGALMTPEARREIANLVLGEIVPTEPRSPLPDCIDASEAVPSFLVACLREKAASAVVEYDAASGDMQIVLAAADGARRNLEPPQTTMRARFLAAIGILADLRTVSDDAGETTAEGCIRHEHAGLPAPLVVVVRRQRLGDLDVVALQFVGRQETERN